jgi:hypothetical protein
LTDRFKKELGRLGRPALFSYRLVDDRFKKLF